MSNASRMTTIGTASAVGSNAIRLSVRTLVFSLFAGLVFPGCAHIPNYYREDGPATTTTLDSPTAADVKRNYEPSDFRTRGTWSTMTASAESGAVTHGALYFEDPFEDKGAGRTDETDPNNVYRYGWEDYVAMPYSYARYTLNWLMLPVSMVVTPPWIAHESDGEISQQLVYFDHDAERVDLRDQRAAAAECDSAEAKSPE